MMDLKSRIFSLFSGLGRGDVDLGNDMLWHKPKHTPERLDQLGRAKRRRRAANKRARAARRKNRS